MTSAERLQNTPQEHSVDTYDFLADPRAIQLTHRRKMRASMQRENDWWLERLQSLCEAPRPDFDFPGYLLATPPFRDLAGKLAAATHRRMLDIASADELDWFVDAFRDYLRTEAGEDVFSSAHPSNLER
jgi:hypothetical protein